jgi:hypothetical protein
MAAHLVEESADKISITIEITKSRDFIQCEESIQEALNEAGTLATAKCLEDFDSDGSPVIIGNTKLTAKRTKVVKKYETPYGVAPVARYAYQDSRGGEVYIPLEHEARIIGGSTPRFARMVSFKYACSNSIFVQKDLAQNHGRTVSRCYIQDVSETVAAHLQDKASRWDYAQSDLPADAVACVAISLDGTCLFYCEEGHRQAMVGTIAFYNAEGERLHTTYVGAAPEHGKATFLARMDEEIARVKKRYPQVRFVGISDGATDYRSWLENYTTTQILDFWHLSEYLHEVAPALFAHSKEKRERWLEETLHSLKHHHGAASRTLKQLDELASAVEAGKGLSADKREKLERARSYLRNNLDRTNYASYRKSHLPIGSGVVEAGCKTLVKQRMCGAGMKWKQRGADVVLTLRAMILGGDRWSEFWRKAAQFGLTKP